MRIKLFCFLFALCTIYANGQEIPVPAISEDSRDKNLVWNKWETENFIVLSLDYGSGLKIKSSVESQMYALQKRWGINDDDFSTKCKLVCVPDPKTLKRFFSLDFPKAEIKSRNGDTAIWIDSDRIEELDGLLVSVCLKDKAPYIRKGIPLIMRGPKFLSEKISSSADSLATISLAKEEEYSKMNPEEREMFDANSAVLCLFIRREFGLDAFSSLVSGRSPQSVCGFKDAKSFESTISRYVKNIKDDVKSGKTPSSYLSP